MLRISFALLLLAGCSSSAAVGAPDFAAPADLLMPDLMLVNQPRGAPCTTDGNCAGANARCLATVFSYAAANGYCSNQPCTTDDDCGYGFCVASSGQCLGLCQDADECQATNPDNRCFTYDSQHAACEPQSHSQCDPTVAGSCPGPRGEGCHRIGFDDVGACLPACSFDMPCVPGQKCLFFNDPIANDRSPTNDKFVGFGCYPQGTLKAPNQPCVFHIECVDGYECNTLGVGGPPLCKKLCRNGTASDCPTGSCQNAFLLPTFAAGAIGLCL